MQIKKKMLQNKILIKIKKKIANLNNCFLGARNLYLKKLVNVDLKLTSIALKMKIKLSAGQEKLQIIENKIII